MTNHHDPIEAWLSQDVELLPPPPGTYQRVRRTARRRKAIQAASAFAGAAVIVAAAAGLPQLAGSLLPSSGPAKIRTSTPAAGSKTARAATPAPTSAPVIAGPALVTAGSRAHPVPAGFRPTSVTFVGYHNGSLGAVIGQAGRSCRGSRCTVVAGTPDYGSTWSRVGAPPAAPAGGAAAVSQIRFATPSDGWAFGPGLWVTRDGGAHWARDASLPGPVIDLSTISGRVLAIAGAGCTGSGADYAAGCTSFSLWSAAIAGGGWQQVLPAQHRTRIAPGALQLTAARGYLIAAGRLYSGPLAGGAWTAVQPAAGAPSCLTSHPGSGPWLLAPGSGALYLVCGRAAAAAALYQSADGGRTWQQRGTVTVAGTPTSLAITPAGTLVLATNAGIAYSADRSSWRPATVSGQVPRGGFAFVGMTTNADGVAVPADQSQRQIFITRDGGRTWAPVTP